MNFAKLRGLTIPEGKVTNITRKSDGKVLWNALPKFRYVSYGDSIAAGHLITYDWTTDYGHWTQYGFDGYILDNEYNWETNPLGLDKSKPDTQIKDKFGVLRDAYRYTRTEQNTVIIPNTYTDHMKKHLESIKGKTNVSVTSFAKSGGTVPSTISLLSENDCNNPAANGLRDANLVTISSGANGILGPALDQTNLFAYLLGSDAEAAAALVRIETETEKNLMDLDNDSHKDSYQKLFDLLNKLNPNAKYIFLTVYNPMKYLQIERGTYANDYEDGFFRELFRLIPDLPNFGIPNFDPDAEIKKYLLDTLTITQFLGRVNVLWDWTEKYLEYANGKSHNGGNFRALNQIIRDKVGKQPNMIVADVHELYDTVPDRQGVGEVHYNDLVNVEFTRGYRPGALDWYRLWEGSDAYTFWYNLLSNHITEIISGNWEGVAGELVPQILEKVLYPSIDPHPRTDGHYLAYRAISEALYENEKEPTWTRLFRVTYAANGGSGSMAVQKVLDKSWGKKIYSILQPNKFTPQTGYYYTGWKDGSGNSYSDKQAVYIPNDVTLNAQWNNEYVVQYYKFTEVLVDDYNNHTGHMELRSLTINGATRTDLNTAFAAKPTKDNRCAVTVRYGDKITIHTHCKPAGWDGGLWFKEHNCNLTYPGGSKTGTDITWTFDWNLINPLKNRNIIIDYQWFYQANTDLIQRWFSWWDCHVKIE